MSDDNVYATPESNLEKPAQETELASRWARLGGALIDGILAIAITFPLMFAMGLWDKAMEQSITIGETVFLAILGFVIFLMLHGYLLAKYGQTIGKRLVGTRIVSYETNEIFPLSRIFFLRFLPVSIAAQIPFIGGIFALVDILFIYRNDKRCVHDLIAGTKVIKA